MTDNPNPIYRPHFFKVQSGAIITNDIAGKYGMTMQLARYCTYLS